MLERIRALKSEGMSHRQIGKKLGICPSTVSRKLSGAKRVSATMSTEELPGTVQELMNLAQVDGSEFQAVNYTVTSRETKDGVKFSSRANFKPIIATPLANAIQQMALHIKPLKKRALPKTRKRSGEEFMVSWGVFDAHIGSYAWAEETGSDYSLEIAEKRFRDSVDAMVLELSLYNVVKLYIPMGNDMLHFDSVKMTTTHSDHHLDTDTRYQKVYYTAMMCGAYLIERAVEVCEDVEVICVPGNHDEVSAFTINVGLSQRFLNDKRITFDLTASPRKYRSYGGVLLGYHHGHKIKTDRLPLLMAEEAKQHWAQKTCAEWHLGHLHQSAALKYAASTPYNGSTIRTNPALCSPDGWHAQNGFIGAVPAVEAWRYDRNGLRGSHTVLTSP